MPSLSRRKILSASPDITTAISALRPGASFAVEYHDDDTADYDSIQWYEENTQEIPTRTEVVAKLNELRAAWDAQEYSRTRFSEYPHVEVQFALLYDDIAAGKFGEDAKTGDWFTTIKAIKDRHPKPES